MKNNSLRYLTILAGCMGTASLAVGAPDQQPAPAQQSPAATTSSPMVRAADQPAKDMRDERVSIGGIKISRPGFTNASGDASRADGKIDVPLNTIGPGLSLRQINDRVDADNTLAEARARLADRQADQPIVTDAFGYPLHGGVPYFLGPVGYSGYGGYGYAPGAARQPLGPISATNSGLSDQLHGQAQANFANAAAAGTGVLGNLHQGAIQSFAAAATPPLLAAEQARASTQINLQKNTLNAKSKK